MYSAFLIIQAERYLLYPVEPQADQSGGIQSKKNNLPDEYIYLRSAELKRSVARGQGSGVRALKRGSGDRQEDSGRSTRPNVVYLLYSSWSSHIAVRRLLYRVLVGRMVGGTARHGSDKAFCHTEQGLHNVHSAAKSFLAATEVRCVTSIPICRNSLTEVRASTQASYTTS